MELDDFKKSWQERDEALDARLSITSLRRHVIAMDKAETSTRRLSRMLGIDVAINGAATLLVGSFLAQNLAEARFLIPGLVLHVAAILSIVAGIRQLFAIGTLDYGGPIVEAQKRMESLRVERLRAIKLTLLAAPLLWTPLLIVSLKGLWNVDAYAVFPSSFLLANLLSGLAVIPLALWVSRRYAARMDRSPFVQRLMAHMAGTSLKDATASLEALARFEKEEGESS